MEYEPILPGYSNYLHDESRLEGQADFICFPENTAQTAEAVRKAIAMGWPLTVQGARTGISGGAVPRGGLILSSEKMTQPLGCRLDTQGRPSLRIQAGMSLEALNIFLNREIPTEHWSTESKKCFERITRQGRYRFTPNPTETTAAMGGVFACNARGPNSLRFNGTGAYTEALTWVTPTGEIWEIERGRHRFDDAGCPLPNGSRLNCITTIPRGVSPLLHPLPGLDLIDFLAGSEGLAGIVTEMDIRLEAVPAHCWAVMYFFTNETGAVDFAQALSRWRITSADGNCLSSVEYYDRASLDIVRQGMNAVTALKQLPPINNNFMEAFHVELEGDDAQSLESALTEQLELFVKSGGNGDNTWAAADRGELEKYRLLRHGVPELINTSIDRIRQTFPNFHKTAADFSVPADRIAAWKNRYHKDMADAGLHGFVFGHILETRLHVNLLAHNDEELRRCRELLEIWAAAVTEEGGILAAENGIGKIKKNLVYRFLSPQRMKQIHGILDYLDPQGIMGRVNT